MSGGAPASADEVEAELAELYADVDHAWARLAERHGDRLQCRRGCSGCCLDGLTVFEVEARWIRLHHRELLERQRASPPGRCAFLGPEGACRIYSSRPQVCRTQGLPLRWLESDEVEHRDICELNEDGVDLVSLPSSACHEVGPIEARLATLQARLQNVRPGATLRRVGLRSLFDAGPLPTAKD